MSGKFLIEIKCTDTNDSTDDSLKYKSYVQNISQDNISKSQTHL
jgi:hypothetical protein